MTCHKGVHSRRPHHRVQTVAQFQCLANRVEHRRRIGIDEVHSRRRRSKGPFPANGAVRLGPATNAIVRSDCPENVVAKGDIETFDRMIEFLTPLYDAVSQMQVGQDLRLSRGDETRFAWMQRNGDRTSDATSMPIEFPELIFVERPGRRAAKEQQQQQDGVHREWKRHISGRTVLEATTMRRTRGLISARCKLRRREKQISAERFFVQ